MLLFLFLVVLQGKSASAVVGPGPICDGWLEQSWPFYLFFQVVLCWNHALWSGQSASVYHQIWTGCCHGLQCCFSPSARSVWCSPISPCSVGRWLCHGHFWCGTLLAGIFRHWLDCPHAQMRASSGICQSPLCFGILCFFLGGSVIEIFCHQGRCCKRLRKNLEGLCWRTLSLLPLDMEAIPTSVSFLLTAVNEIDYSMR